MTQLSRDARAALRESPALKTYAVARTPHTYKVTCPRCKRHFWTQLDWFTISEYKTRSCPYCFKTSKLPKKKPKR